jgi:hypothetical protein
LDSLTPKSVRAALEVRLGYSPGELESHKKQIGQAIKEALARIQPQQPKPAEDEVDEHAAIPAASASGTAAVAGSVPFASLPALPGVPLAQSSSNAGKKRQAPASDDDDGDEGEDDEEEGAASKRARAADGSAAAVAVSSTPGRFKIGPTRQVEVRKFKGQILVDIRETYIDKTSGEEKPGSKGIALKPEQWEALLKQAQQISQYVNKMQMQR